MVLWFFAGLLLLLLGAEILVRGASGMARAAGISGLVIGLTVVALGTSMPELAVSLEAGLQNLSDVAVANVVGSNIFNLLAILGVCALIAPLAVARHVTRLDVPVMLGAAATVWLVSLDGRIGAGEGGLMLLLLISYLGFRVWGARRESRELRLAWASMPESSRRPRWRTVAIACAMILAGLLMLVLGARWLIAGLLDMAAVLGLSPAVASLLIAAAGTSLPELATSAAAVAHRESDMAVGNIIGSCIFNLLGILGLVAVFQHGGTAVAAQILHVDLPVMVAASAACLPVFFTGHAVVRWEGVALLFYFLTYVAYRILAVAAGRVVPSLRHVVIGFILPLTVLVVVRSVVRTNAGDRRLARAKARRIVEKTPRTRRRVGPPTSPPSAGTG